MNTRRWGAGIVLAIFIALVSASGQTQAAPGGVPGAIEDLRAQIQALQDAVNDLLAQVTSVGDGVILIDQSRALTGNVTPGDEPGFPVSITQPGSYRLSGNLTVPASSNGIEVSADGVSLDLNGFVVAGGGENASAIRATGAQHHIAIQHGTISDFSFGIQMPSSNHVVVRDILGTNPSPLSTNVSINVGRYSTIQRNSVQGLIAATCPSVLTENVTEGFITVLLIGNPAPQCVRWNNRSIDFDDAVTQ